MKVSSDTENLHFLEANTKSNVLPILMPEAPSIRPINILPDGEAGAV